MFFSGIVSSVKVSFNGLSEVNHDLQKAVLKINHRQHFVQNCKYERSQYTMMHVYYLPRFEHLNMHCRVSVVTVQDNRTNHQVLFVVKPVATAMQSW